MQKRTLAPAASAGECRVLQVFWARDPHARTSRLDNGRLRDELLNGEIFTTLKEAQIVIEGWRQHYNRVRPHSSLGYKPPAPEIVAWPASPAVEGVRPAIALRPRLN